MLKVKKFIFLESFSPASALVYLGFVEMGVCGKHINLLLINILRKTVPLSYVLLRNIFRL